MTDPALHALAKAALEREEQLIDRLRSALIKGDDAEAKKLCWLLCDLEQHGFVYVLRSGELRIAKIGYTENLEARLGNQRRWSNGLMRPAPELQAVLVCEFETCYEAASFEQRLLFMYENRFGVEGRPVDWFTLTAEHEEEIAAYAATRPGFVSAWGRLDPRAVCRFCGGLFQPGKAGKVLCSAACRAGDRESKLARSREA